jgi:hypothetical protein
MWPVVKDHFWDFVYWLSILATSILSAIIGTVVPSIIKQASAPRNHNYVRLCNECIARHQFAYVPYFITLGLVGHFGKWEPLRTLIPVFILWVIVSYFVSVNLSTQQDHAFVNHHQCDTKNPECKKDVGRADFTKMFRSNIQLAKVLLGVGIVFAAIVKR